jgi:hypothetical protein
VPFPPIRSFSTPPGARFDACLTSTANRPEAQGPAVRLVPGGFPGLELCQRETTSDFFPQRANRAGDAANRAFALVLPPSRGGISWDDGRGAIPSGMRLLQDRAGFVADSAILRLLACHKAEESTT